MSITKKFKIGERAIGGIIKVEIDTFGDTIRIAACDFYTSKEIRASGFRIKAFGCRNAVDNYLNELTDSYHTEKVMKWIDKQTLLN